MKLTHWQYLQSVKHLLSRACTSLDRRADGTCMNCGHNPAMKYRITFIVQS